MFNPAKVLSIYMRMDKIFIRFRGGNDISLTLMENQARLTDMRAEEIHKKSPGRPEEEIRNEARAWARAEYASRRDGLMRRIAAACPQLKEVPGCPAPVFCAEGGVSHTTRTADGPTLRIVFRKSAEAAASGFGFSPQPHIPLTEVTFADGKAADAASDFIRRELFAPAP
jgi:hypothetical protein